MRLGEVGIEHHRLPELIEAVRVVAFTPIERAQAGMRLRVVGLEFESLLVRGARLRNISFSRPNYPGIVVARRQRRTRLNRFLKILQSFVEAILLQRLGTLQDQTLR